jgi:hypothetical protein
MDVEIDGVDGDEVAEALAQVPDLDQRMRSVLFLVNGGYVGFRPLWSGLVQCIRCRF